MSMKNRSFSGLNPALWVTCIAVCLLTVFSGNPAMAQPTITHGPVVGAVTHESARIIVRTSESVVVEFELSTDEDDFTGAIVSNELTSDEENDYFVILDISGNGANS